MEYDRTKHAARATDDYVFQQLIPYIGNKRKLLWLIDAALQTIDARPNTTFVDLFAGSTVVSRYAKQRGFRVISNDWEPYAEAIARAAIGCNTAPPFKALGGYEAAIARLNALPPQADWITNHLCPADDHHFDTRVDRLFFMRKNGMRIDAIRNQIETWAQDGTITDTEKQCLLAPLLYQVCYTSNTSGLFKAFHEGWGGSNGTATYRICGDLHLKPYRFFDNGAANEVHRMDATALAQTLTDLPPDAIVYLDPPYNQHPYASNYHVLNTVTLWDNPPLTPKIEGRNKAAIRDDWRTARRSAYNYRHQATQAFADLIDAIPARHILISYSTDGIIPLEEMVAICLRAGQLGVVKVPYKRYRVSPTRPSEKPVTVEFILTLQKGVCSHRPDVAAITQRIQRSENKSAFPNQNYAR